MGPSYNYVLTLIFLEPCKNYSNTECIAECSGIGQTGMLYLNPTKCFWVYSCKCANCVMTQAGCTALCEDQGKSVVPGTCTVDCCTSCSCKDKSTSGQYIYCGMPGRWGLQQKAIPCTTTTIKLTLGIIRGPRQQMMNGVK